MSQRLQQKTAVVTGAGSGIGSAIARLFAREGARVALLDLTTEATGPLARQLQQQTGQHGIACVADVTDRKQVQQAINQVEDTFGQIDILVNCAGINVFRDALALAEEEWQRCMNVNLQGPYNLIRAVIPGMLRRRYGNIVNVASVHGHKIIPGAFPYPVAKHGLIGLTRSLGVEYAGQGIRINSISPGLILTPSAEAWLASCPDPQAERQKQQDLLPCKRIGEPEEVAYTALFLASDEARFINATDILIDGGRSQVYHD
ncbi:SDR family oxidoreductase [Biostraticola tofi]|uniref:NAD(P)-dependent dehydrogenase (Short-subunit alcohol dehydrogenase family) n=1 Tax=Biostraticola tofi TaxID=466109 RepID=A0A4R3YGH4_9GAMM|nr:SDR family oxidoreductase [Biostraticola tofi]TCV91695.1 NAD(P)-dependent dehydrogenase (short-subunit alcohol dehydrogenase family) [Biostraticola tofi]